MLYRLQCLEMCFNLYKMHSIWVFFTWKSDLTSFFTFASSHWIKHSRFLSNCTNLLHLLTLFLGLVFPQSDQNLSKKKMEYWNTLSYPATFRTEVLREKECISWEKSQESICNQVKPIVYQLCWQSLEENSSKIVWIRPFLFLTAALFSTQEVLGKKFLLSKNNKNQCHKKCIFMALSMKSISVRKCEKTHT